MRFESATINSIHYQLQKVNSFHKFCNFVHQNHLEFNSKMYILTLLNHKMFRPSINESARTVILHLTAAFLTNIE
jgi:hypothetical protein